MLIVKVFVNARQIDELHIQRTGEWRGFYTYTIRKPEGYEDERIAHRYADGYRPLLAQVLERLTYTNYPTKPTKSPLSRVKRQGGK